MPALDAVDIIIDRRNLTTRLFDCTLLMVPAFWPVPPRRS